MVFDYRRERLWWSLLLGAYNTAIVQWDINNTIINQLSIRLETGLQILAKTIDVDLDSGNLILAGSSTTQSYLFQIFRDNNTVLSTTFLPEYLT